MSGRHKEVYESFEIVHDMLEDIEKNGLLDRSNFIFQQLLENDNDWEEQICIHRNEMKQSILQRSKQPLLKLKHLLN
jgi:hypothetical protein